MCGIVCVCVRVCVRTHTEFDVHGIDVGVISVVIVVIVVGWVWWSVCTVH